MKRDHYDNVYLILLFGADDVGAPAGLVDAWILLGLCDLWL